jgi:hypothetical protein
VVLFSAYDRNEIALSIYRDSRAGALYNAGKAKRGAYRDREGPSCMTSVQRSCKSWPIHRHSIRTQIMDLVVE